jgi:DNA polymerase
MMYRDATLPVIVPNCAPAPVAHNVLVIDGETRSTVTIKAGANYLAASATDVICVALGWNTNPVTLWIPPALPPAEWLMAIEDGECEIVAHNVSFEKALVENILYPRYGWPRPREAQWSCTMVRATSLALPASLEKLGPALGLQHLKDRDGHRVMLRCSKPRKARKDENKAVTHWFDDDERIGTVRAYCRADVECERELHHQLDPLSPAEWRLWQLSERINARGYPIDRRLAEAMAKLSADTIPVINAELAAVTDGAVTTVNQVAKFQTWLAVQGCVLPDLARETVIEALDRPQPAPVRRALELRQEGGQAAAKKLTSLLQLAGPDDRVRHGFMFHAAAPGRWAGKGFQFQNQRRLTRPLEELEAAMELVLTGYLAVVKAKFPNVLEIIGELTRLLIAAPPGFEFVGCDLSAIESRVLCWLSGERKVVNAYRKFDITGDAEDEPYRVAARLAFGLPANAKVDAEQRRIGKICTLAFGYQGGVGAFRNFSADYSDAEVQKFVADWRAAHPSIVRFWYGCDAAAVDAVNNPGKITACGLIRFKVIGRYLRVRLPSGRAISYPYPEIIFDHGKPRVSFHDNASGRWAPCRDNRGYYGGCWVENIVQGTARDLLTEGMLRLDEAGYPLIAHCHDEALAEVPEGTADVPKFVELMTRPPRWAQDLPVSAKGWSGRRYAKAE